MACKPACADGGQVRAVQRSGRIQVTVFSSPSPMRAGWADISVAVYNTATGEVCEDAQILVTLKHLDPAVSAISTAATSQAATNRLLKAAFVKLPEQGTWDVMVHVSVDSIPTAIETNFAMDVAAPLPAWLTEWSWFCWPLVPILLFIVHRMLVAARSRSRQNQGQWNQRIATTRTASSQPASRTG